MLTVYSKGACPQCSKAKQVLDYYNIEYKEVKIDEDSEAREFVVSNGHKSVPQLYVNKTLLVENGYVGLAAMDKDDVLKKIEELNES